ncbi:MAG: imidazole glycerol phosphate synthase subunit HisH [Microbacteriaceae bacterium]|nr:imidazole glycerol phosphate synthase subunit HisH [Microbacteriaceae bacterium]
MSPTQRPAVAVLDIGLGDVDSVVDALTAAGAEATVTHDRDLIANADGLVVIGDGEFAAVIEQLRAVHGDEFIERRLAGGRPVLAIGVGMQILFDGAIVGDVDTEGLAQWPGVVTELDAPTLPHSGWSTVEAAPDSVLFAGIEGELFHFTHSHAATEWTLEAYGAFAAPRVTYATHGERFIAAVENGPLSATQFHPENSGDAGLHLLRNWIASF